jgi:hypothetical protein
MTDRIIIQKRPPKSPAAAGIFSGFFPGTGQLLNGEYLKGVLFIIIFAGLITMQTHTRTPFPGLLIAGFYIFQIIEAVQSAREINRLALAANGAASAGQTSAPPITEAAAVKTVRSGSVFWGIVLMGLGTIFLLSNFDIIHYDQIFDFWPAVVILVGLKMIFDYFSKKNT